jgi:hypothetical protein
MSESCIAYKCESPRCVDYFCNHHNSTLSYKLKKALIKEEKSWEFNRKAEAEKSAEEEVKVNNQKYCKINMCNHPKKAESEYCLHHSTYCNEGKFVEENKEVVIVQQSNSIGESEVFCEWFHCPKCEETDIQKSYSFCPNCGVAIKFAPKKKKAKFPKFDVKLNWG